MLHAAFRAKHAASVITSIAGASAVFLAPSAQAGTAHPLATRLAVSAASEVRETAAPGTVYVQPGGTLSQIAATYCGSARDWAGIYQANRATLTSGPNVVYPGEALRISCGGYQAPAQVSYQPAAQPQVTTAASTAGAAPGSFQACVIARESGGNPAAVNPSSGAGGLYQFLPSTWASLGYSGLPENASAAEQTQAFNKLYAESGTSPWQPSDGCS